MVVFTNFPPPTEGIKFERSGTTVVMNQKELGKGTIYIAERRLSWVDSHTGEGFSLEYPHISIHAISRDLQTYPKECLYVMIDTNVDFSKENEPDESLSDDGIQESDITEFRFIPDDIAVLNQMYQAMSYCQTLHPDPDDSVSEDEDEDDDDDLNDGGFVDGDEDILNESNGTANFDMEVDGQFDDADTGSNK